MTRRIPVWLATSIVTLTAIAKGLPMTHRLFSDRLDWLRRAGACAGLLALAAAMPAAAQNNALTIYAGARVGGEFTDANDSDRTLTLDGGAAWSASLDLPVGDGRQWQLFVSHQGSGLPADAFAQSGTVDVDVTYVHLGGRVFFDGDLLRGGSYAVGGVGVTRLSPGLDGLSAETRPSLNIGVGHEWKLAPAVALRGEVRVYATAIGGSGSLFCSGGCVVRLRADTLVQGEALLGLSVGF